MSNIDQIDIVANATKTLTFNMNALMGDVRKTVQEAINKLGAEEVQKRLALWTVAEDDDDEEDEDEDEDGEEDEEDDEELDDDDEEDEDDDKYDAP